MGKKLEIRGGVIEVGRLGGELVLGGDLEYSGGFVWLVGEV